MVEKTAEKTVQDNAELKQKLTPEQYHVTQEAGTECAFTGKYWDTKDPGMYHCVCCGAPLFDSRTKFNSGTGWPSFNKPEGGGVVEHRDTKYGWCGPRCAAPSATRIWDMCLRMVRRRQRCGTA
jgi:peptide-methionine (R)-S-oxide reductase